MTDNGWMIIGQEMTDDLGGVIVFAGRMNKPVHIIDYLLMEGSRSDVAASFPPLGYVKIRAVDYASALRELFDQWSPDQQPGATRVIDVPSTAAAAISPPARACVDCGVSIEERHHLARLCIDCGIQRNRARARKQRADR